MTAMLILRPHKTSVPREDPCGGVRIATAKSIPKSSGASSDEPPPPGRAAEYAKQVLISLAGQLGIITSFLMTYWLLNRLVGWIK